MVRNNDLVDEQRRMYADEPQGRHMASAHSLVEVLDGIVMLYPVAAHKQLGKVCAAVWQLIISGTVRSFNGTGLGDVQCSL